MAQDEKTTMTGEPSTAPVSIVPTISQARLHTIIAGLWLCLFMSAMDTTIVTTSLIKISSGFDALEQGAWLVTAYLLTYNSFLMITAKLSDIWGLKTLLISCAAIFLIFSMACGAAQSMVQLIVFRAFQGIGGSALYSLTFVAIMKLVVPEKIGFYSGVISSVFAMANLLGPLFGGIISDRTTWRWIFFLNGPIMIIAMILLFISLPALKDGKTNIERIRGLDSLGGILSVCWPIPLIFALQEAGGAYQWNSGIVIGTLTAGIALFVIFGVYEAWVTYKTPRDPIFPIHFLKNPSMALILLSQFLVGMPFYVIFVQLPQRFQSVNFTSAERAGILLLPATLMTPVGAMAAGLAAKKVPIEIVLIASGALVCVGVGLLGSLPSYSHLWPGTYGFEIITGLGLGLSNPPYFMLVATSVAEKDMAVGTGALNMVRTLGGCVAVAICSAIHREFLSSRLSAFLSPSQIAAVQQSSGYVAHLPEETRNRIGDLFGRSYNRQFQIMLAFAGLNVIVTVILMVVRKKLGIFGVMPVRKEENEFTKAAAPKRDDVETSEKNVNTTEITVSRSASPKKDSETTAVSHPPHSASTVEKSIQETT
ncbi:MFS general substrate transporter [Ophiobolus disseminans]|uniref:MFS general substrate transporter n=1 Tax=Ophiobolus disseminans TaxID=1469910 RepID=A0A6A7AHP6_9PLEO|nr:MFS general substrate transporter [Ophiobolus disseminans]